MEEVQLLTQLDDQSRAKFAKALQRTLALIRTASDESRQPAPSDCRSGNSSKDSPCGFEPRIIVQHGLQNFIPRFIHDQSGHGIDRASSVSERHREIRSPGLPDLISDRKRWQAMGG